MSTQLQWPNFNYPYFQAKMRFAKSQDSILSNVSAETNANPTGKTPASSAPITPKTPNNPKPNPFDPAPPTKGILNTNGSKSNMTNSHTAVTLVPTATPPTPTPSLPLEPTVTTVQMSHGNGNTHNSNGNGIAVISGTHVSFNEVKTLPRMTHPAPVSQPTFMTASASSVYLAGSRSSTWDLVLPKKPEDDLDKADGSLGDEEFDDEEEWPS